MQFQKKEKRQTTVRFDSHHVRLRTGEVQRKTGSYMYRWTDKLGKRNTIYAATLEDLREQEEQILVDQHDGIKANIKNVTVNDVYELWCQLKRGIKDSTMKNYIYMYELFVKPTFGKKKLVQVKKSDVRRFYNQLIDDKVLKPSTVDVIHAVIPELRLAFAFSQKGTDREAKVAEVLHFLCKAKRIQLFVIRQKDPIALATEIKQAFAKANLFINSDSQRDVAHLRKRYFAQKNNGN